MEGFVNLELDLPAEPPPPMLGADANGNMIAMERWKIGMKEHTEKM
jgi:hypothetical protein